MHICRAVMVISFRWHSISTTTIERADIYTSFRSQLVELGIGESLESHTIPQG